MAALVVKEDDQISTSPCTAGRNSQSLIAVTLDIGSSLLQMFIVLRRIHHERWENIEIARSALNTCIEHVGKGVIELDFPQDRISLEGRNGCWISK